MDLVVVGLEFLGDDVGIDELVADLAMGILEADREGLQVLLAGLGEQRDDQAGIDAPRQQHADRHVGDHAPVHRQPQRREQPFAPLVCRHVDVRVGALVVHLPVDVVLHAAVRLDDPDGGRRQLLDALEDRPRGGHHGMERHVVVQADPVDLGVDAAAGDEGGQGGGEAQLARRLGDVERLDAEAVTGQHDAAAVALEDGEGEHAVEALHAGRSPRVIRLQDHLGVGVREERIALGLQLLAQFRIVVDAAVEGDRQAEIGVHHRLFGARRQVDDRQAAMAEHHPAAPDDAFGVRAARRHRFGHACKCGGGRHRPVEGQFAANATHTSVS